MGEHVQGRVAMGGILSLSAAQLTNGLFIQSLNYVIDLHAKRIVVSSFF